MDHTDGFSVKAILGGTLVDIVATVVLSFLSGFAIRSVLSWSVPPAELAAAMEAKLAFIAQDAAWLLCFLLLGVIVTAAAGFTAGRLAGTAHLRNGVAVGAVLLVIGLALWVLAPEIIAHGNQPTWMVATGFVLTVPAAALGGLLSSTSLAWPWTRKPAA